MEMRVAFLRTLAMFWALLGFALLSSTAGWAVEPYQVMVVSSYSPEYHWTQEVNQGIRTVLGDRAELHFFYLETKRSIARGTAKAEKIYRQFLKMQPDGVIAVDDNAQWLFVKPYLADRFATPVIFCGVNADPGIYGYPATNVSGVIERVHFSENLAFSIQLDPSIQSFAFMARMSPTTDQIVRQLKFELTAGKLVLPNVAVLRPQTLSEAVTMAEKQRGLADCLLLDTLEGVLDDDGVPLTDAQAIPEVLRAFGGASASTNARGVDYGALSGVVKSGFEQGEKAARMLLQVLLGTPLEELPVQRNYRGIRRINVTTLKQLELVPDPMFLRGAELVRGQ